MGPFTHVSLPSSDSCQPFAAASPWLSGWHNCVVIIRFNVRILILFSYPSAPFAGTFTTPFHHSVSSLYSHVFILILRFALLCAFHFWRSETPLHLTQDFISPH